VVGGKGFYYKGGQKFEKFEDPAKEGLITSRNFGGTAKWRTCYTSDGTGHAVLYTMDNRATQMGVQVHDRIEAISMIHDGEACQGVVARCLKTGKLRLYLAKATLVATGGYGRIYKNTTNAVICEGGGQSIALDTGVVSLGNMEAIQFHPTGIVPTDILVTEGCRGDGGTLLDRNEDRFMPDYEPEKAELASRDVVSRRMIEHIRKGLGVKNSYGDDNLWLDIRHLGETHIRTKLREVDEICQNFLGIDPLHQLIPVRPTHHYSMGGVRTDKDGAAYGLKGLFAAGEAACWDLHGFNRLGGNSLAETVVAGKIIGAKVVEYLKGATATFKTSVIDEQITRDKARIRTLISGGGKENVFELRNMMQEALMKGVGIFRNEKDLEQAVRTLQEVQSRTANLGLVSNGLGANPELAMALKLPGMVRMALCVAYGALERRESRGCHAREDYPARNDRDWLVRTLATWKEGADLPTLKYEPVTPSFELPPGERGYGGGKIISADEKEA
jgi:fumarate reductase flavoprotein subunit